MNNQTNTDKPEWIDKHSVTCIICSGLAHEESSVKINQDAITPGKRKTNPETTRLITDLINEHGTGEAHPYCFEIALNQGLETAIETIDKRISRS